MSDPIKHLGLLLIDLQDTFLQAIPNRDDLLQRCSFAIEAAALLGARIAVTEQLPAKLGPTHSELASLLPEHTVFEKSAFSALRAEGVARWIETSQLDHLLILGIETPICIYQTAVDALGEAPESPCWPTASPSGARTASRSCSSCWPCKPCCGRNHFYSLLGDADHPLFRAYTELVKRYQQAEALPPTTTPHKETQLSESKSTTHWVPLLYQNQAPCSYEWEYGQCNRASQRSIPSPTTGCQID